MKAQQTKVRFLTQAGGIAGMYAALCLVLAPISYGPVQVRLAEALTILPVFTPAAIPGLAVGCFLANLFSGGVVGGWDWLFGTLATLVAAVLSYVLRRVTVRGWPVVATLPPVVLNAVVVGAECAVAGGNAPGMFWLFAGQVAAGQVVACVAGGLLLAHGLRRIGWHANATLSASSHKRGTR